LGASGSGFTLLFEALWTRQVSAMPVAGDRRSCPRYARRDQAASRLRPRLTLRDGSVIARCFIVLGAGDGLKRTASLTDERRLPRLAP
jgi:hypothetical protein